MINRIPKFQKLIEKPILIKKKENIFYLTGQMFISGFLLVTPKSAVFFGDGLEKVTGVKADEFRNLPKYMRAGTTLFIEGDINVREYALIKKLLPKVKLEHKNGIVEAARVIKTKEEIAFIKDAVKLTHEVFNEVKEALASDSWTEKQLARLIHYSGIGLGAQGISFDPIVAAGENSAIPHHKPTDRKIKAGEPVILDFGFKVGEYCSDFTRTVFLKKSSKEFAELYKHTKNAYDEAFTKLTSGMKGKEIDALSRTELKKQKLDKMFIHSLGHGTGLEIHEHPGVGPFSEAAVLDGMVMSIEPGVYIKGKGGIRIEDLVYLEKGKAVQFAECSRELKDNIIK